MPIERGERRDEDPTLRDRFAMAALSGLLAGHNAAITIRANCESAYVYADAMLAARVKPAPSRADTGGTG